jgi:hypothetical protein
MANACFEVSPWLITAFLMSRCVATAISHFVCTRARRARVNQYGGHSGWFLPGILMTPWVAVVALLPMFPIRNTIVCALSLRVSHGRSGPSFKTWFPPREKLPKSMRGKHAGFNALQASVPWVYQFIHHDFKCLVQVKMIHLNDLVENQTVKAQRHLPMNSSCRTRPRPVATNKFKERFGSYAARLARIREYCERFSVFQVVFKGPNF